ncbi:MAG TPA: cytochrome c [Methylomirabilota bacterium]|nr:cytochrome c [Methylomirabilota bacterium]
MQPDAFARNRPPRFSSTVGCVFTLLETLSLAVLAVAQATPPRSITAGVYSTAQAARGGQIYRSQCAACHGNALEGSSGPPLVGDTFLSNWSAKPLASLVEKIQKTMPFNLPGKLSTNQSIDLSAYLLQVAKFDAGQGELSATALTQIVFPSVRAAATPAAPGGASGSLPPPEGNLAELMRAIAFPNSNIIFNAQLKDPGVQPKKQPGSAPFDYVEWGATVYPGWLAIDQAAVAITETAPLLLTPGRRCQNGKAVPVDRADWKQYVAELVEVGKLARATAKTRNFEAFVDVSEKLNDACANCHKVYRDKGGTEGSGTTRCQPPAQEK